MPNRAYDTEQKGRYYRLDIKNGRAVLEPVHVTTPEEEERKKRAQEQTVARAVTRNRSQVLVLNARRTVLFTAALAVCCVACAVYVYSISAVTATQSRIASLQSEIETLAGENDMTEDRIYNSLNLFEIQETVETLGMTSISDSQVKYYTLDETNYLIRFTVE